MLELYKCDYSLTVKQELRAAARYKQGGGPDSALGPCVCHLYPKDSEESMKISCMLIDKVIFLNNTKGVTLYFF